MNEYTPDELRSQLDLLIAQYQANPLMEIGEPDVAPVVAPDEISGHADHWTEVDNG